MGTFIAVLIALFITWLYYRERGQKPEDRLEYYFGDLNEGDLDDRTKKYLEYLNNIPEYTEKQRIKDYLGFLLLFLFIMFLISYFLY